jgi:MtaA/CmuA family methyltransferase
MNSKERVLAALEGDLPDRVPVFIMSRHFSMRQKQVGFKACLEDLSGEKYAAAQENSWKVYGYDGVMDLEGVNAESEALGCVLEIYEDESPAVIKPRIQHYEAVKDLQIPDFEKNSIFQRQLNVVKALKRRLGDEVPVYGNVQCPFRSAVMLRGLNDFMLDLIGNPKGVHDLLEFTTAVAIAYGKRLVECGADILMPSNPLASGNLISAEHYKEFAYPYDREMVASFKDEGIKTILHICGKVQDRLYLIADTGYDGVSVDSVVNLQRAKEEVGDRICLVGNVDVFRPLRKGSAQQVWQKALECIEAAGSGGRFMLSASCEIIADTPEENLRALVDAARGTV